MNYCFNKIYFALFCLLIFAVLLYQYYLISKYSNKNINPDHSLKYQADKKYIRDEIIDVLNKFGVKDSGIIENQRFFSDRNNRDVDNNIIINSPVREIDPVINYDYGKIFDPLVEPTRRIDRQYIPPAYIKQLIDFPSRGYPDNFNQFGILVKKNKKNKTDTDNNILRLFGRQEFPGSNRYEYYTAIVNGLDQIKIPLEIKQNELYDRDIIYIRELGCEYVVQLHKYDAPKYLPDIL